jgi:sulfate permease, SulP family
MYVFRPQLWDTLKSYDRSRFTADVISGIVVGIVALPLSIALGIASGVSPEKGLITAVIGGFLISLFGGSRVQVAGPTGAFIVVLYGIVQQFGVEGLMIATVMAGAMMILLGLLKAGSLIQFMPYPIIVGFTSGIAVIILFSQVKDFFGIGGGVVPADFTDKLVFYGEHMASLNYYALGIGIFTIITTVYGGRLIPKIPGSLLAILAGVLIVNVFNIPVETIGSRFGEISSSIPAPSFPSLSYQSVKILLLPAFSIAMLGSIESLLSAMVADGATGYRHRPNTELVANGIANILLPIFGGIPACGAVARTMTNVRNGGTTPVAGIVHAVFVLLVLLFLGKWARLIPMASLAGILFVVAYNMSEWRSFKAMFRNSKSEIAVLLTTFLLTVLVDISVAIQFGLVLAAFLFVRRVSEYSGIEVPGSVAEDSPSDIAMGSDAHKIPDGVEVFQIKGPFFFGVANRFDEAEKQLGRRPQIRIIRMRYVPFIDSTGVRNLRSFIVRSTGRNIRVMISGLEEKPYAVLEKNGIIDLVGPENVFPVFEDALKRATEAVLPDKHSTAAVVSEKPAANFTS